MSLALVAPPAAAPAAPAAPPTTSPANGAAKKDFAALLDDAAVAGQPDEEDGEAPTAFIVSPGAEPSPETTAADVTNADGNAVIAAAVMLPEALSADFVAPPVSDQPALASSDPSAETNTVHGDAPQAGEKAADTAHRNASNAPLAERVEAPVVPVSPVSADNAPLDAQPATASAEPPPVAATRDSQAPTAMQGKPPASKTKDERADRLAAVAALEQALAATQPSAQAVAPSDGGSGRTARKDAAAPAATHVTAPITPEPEPASAEAPFPPPSASAVRMAIDAFARAEGQTGQRATRDHERGAGEFSSRGQSLAGLAAEGMASPLFHTTMESTLAGVDSTTPTIETGGESAAVPDLTPQLVKGVTLHWRGALGDARIQLEPEHLGPVTVDLHVGPHGVDATLQSDSAVVRGWIEAHAGDLRDSLAGQGLQLATLTVTADPQEQRRRQAPREAPGEQRRDTDAPTESWQEIEAKALQ